MTLDDINNLQPEDIKKIGSAPLPVRIGAIIVICILVGIAGYFLMIKPQIKNLESLENKEKDLRQQFEQQQRKASNLEAYEKQLEEMKVTFGSMLKSLPDETEVESLLIEISRAGSFNNMEIDLFEPQGEVSKEFYAEYPIKMELEGTYAQMAGFVSSIAALQRIVTLDNIELKIPQEARSNRNQNDEEEESVDGNKPLSISLTAKTYRYLTDEEASQ